LIQINSSSGLTLVDPSSISDAKASVLGAYPRATGNGRDIDVNQFASASKHVSVARFRRKRIDPARRPIRAIPPFGADVDDESESGSPEDERHET
jgi:hypothetical protein